MNKTLLIFSIPFLLLSLFFKTNTLAQTDISASSSFYHIWDGESLDTTIYLVLSTQSSSTVITYYTVTIPQADITPKIFSINRNKELEPTIHRTKDDTSLVIDLEQTPIYPDRPLTLKITYTTKLTEETPSLLSSVVDTQTKDFFFTYPTSKGDVSWSSSPVIKTERKGDSTQIQTETPNGNFVKVTFGSDIVYKFVISKTITNLENDIRVSEILLPVNNNYQNILIDKITPLPDKAYKDIDNNYILQYSVAPQSNLSITVDGYIFMKSSTNPFEIQPNIENISLWEINNASLTRHINRYLKSNGMEISDTFSDIKELKTTEERALLYQNLYRYVIENLQPNIQSVGSLSGSDRLGGQEVLVNQNLSTSEDYIDSIVSLYRYFKIPARFVIGYITGISNYDSNGIYHYWAEYYDSDKKNWVIVEPFFEDYSKTSLYGKDMKEHVTLIYRYSNPYTPKLNFFSEEDFKIELVKDIPEVKNSIKLDVILQPYKISDPYLVGYISIKNTGNTVLDSFNITESNPDLTKYIDYIENNSQIILLPDQTYNIKFNIPYKDIKESLSAVVKALSGTQQLEDTRIEKDIQILKEQSNLKIFSKLISILIYILFSIPIYFLSKRVKLKNG
ncbi:MAG TPA: transglutaminase domain-containing protein [Candidatus Dojkabacteria bacterium]|nr:transglutaminase domain-containing protein [Candidatus Dojkabacteria bacterium]